MSFNTQGFDTVYAIRVSSLNAGMANSGFTPPRIYSTDAAGNALEGTAGDWKFASRKGGVHALFTLQQGKLMSGGALLDASGTEVEVALEMGSLPGTVPGTARAAFLIAASGGSAGQVSLVAAPSEVQKQEALVTSLLGSYFQAHAGEFSFVFLETAPAFGNVDSWLEPATVRFAVGPEDSAGDLSVGVFAMVSGANAPPAPVAGSSALPAGWASGYFLSQALVLTHLVAPALAQSFGLAPNAFVVVPLLGQLMFSGEIALESQKVGLITYHPKCNAVVATLRADGTLNILMEIGCDMGAGIHLKFTVGTNHPFHFNASTQQMSFLAAVGKPEVQYLEPSGKSLEVIFSLVDAIVRVIQLELIKRLTQFTAMNLELSGIPTFVRWSGLPGAKIRSAALEGGLQLEGVFA